MKINATNIKKGLRYLKHYGFKEFLIRLEEKKEQDLLRKEFIASVRGNLVNQLNNIDMVNEDGTIENLGEKYGNKKRNS